MMTSESSDSVKSSMSSLTPSLLTLDDLQQSASRTRDPGRPPPLPGLEMREMAGQPPAEGRGAVNAPTSSAAATGGAVARARQPGGATVAAPPLRTGSTLPPQIRSSDNSMAALLQQLHLQQQQHIQQQQHLQQQQQQAQREHREEMAEMKRYLREALGRPNMGGAGPIHPQESEVGHFGYGPPLPSDPRAGFQEEYEGSERVSPTPSNHSQASTSRFLTM